MLISVFTCIIHLLHICNQNVSSKKSNNVVDIHHLEFRTDNVSFSLVIRRLSNKSLMPINYASTLDPKLILN